MDNKHLQPESEGSELRIVLLGKTGVGKSASGNTILRSDRFTTSPSSESATTRCEKETRDFDGRTLVIVDTPGLFHTSKNHEDVMKEILNCITSISPGPHVFLLVLRLGSFSREDKQTLESFQKVFQDSECHTIVLFTHGDQCEVDTFIQRKKYLRKFISESCEAYHVFNNEVKDESQVTVLLQKINNMVQKNKGRYYSNEMLEKAAIALEEVMQRPEVKSTSDPKEAAMQQLEDWISKGLAVVREQAPGSFGGVMWFLKKVQDVAYKCMPPEAFS